MLQTPQGNTTTSCTSCKTLKRQNRQLLKFNSELKEQLIELNKDYHQLLEAKIKVEGQLEVLQDQLHEETAEKKNLKQIVPDLQRAISLIENSCRVSSATATSGAQQTLSRIRDLMREQSKYEKPTTVLKRRHIRVHPSDSSKRDSTLSMFSDTSSVAEGSLADEDVIQRHSSDSLSQVLTPEQNRLGMDVTKPVVSDLHRSLTYSPTPFTNQPIIRRDINEPSGHVQATENTIQAPKLMLATVQGHSNQSAQEIPHDHEHVRSESSPTMDVFSTSTSIKSYDQPNTNPRKTRHYSVPEVPTIKGRSQSFRQESRAKPSPSQYRIQTDVRTQGDARDNELSAILSKIREKVDSESETLKQNLTQ